MLPFKCSGFKPVVFLLFFLCSGVARSQNPQYAKCCGESSAVFPFKDSVGSRNQLWYNPSDFPGLASNGYISRVFFRSVHAGQWGTYRNFTVSMKQPASGSAFVLSQGFEADSFVQVISKSSITINGASVAGGWYAISLDKPFYYDRSKPLIVEINHERRTSGPGIYNGASLQSAVHKISATPQYEDHAGEDRFLEDFGFDLIPRVQNNLGVMLASAPSGCAGNYNIKVRVKNTGTNAVNTATLKWEIDGQLQAPVNLTSLIDTTGGNNSNDTIITLGSIILTNQAKSVRVWTGLPNGLPDQSTFDDTLHLNFKAKLNGVYTVGTPSSDYADLQQAVDDLKVTGVCGPVTFNVTPRSGPYPALRMSGIDFLTENNCLTIHGNGNMIYDTVAPVIYFERSAYITIDSFLVTGGNRFNGVLVHVTENAHHLAFRKNKLKGGIVNSSFLSSNIIIGKIQFPYSDGSHHITISGNEIIGGAFGIGIFGNKGTNSGHVITNNMIRNFVTTGTYISQTDSVIISGNDIHRIGASTPATTGITGIRLVYSRLNLLTGNKIHDLGSLNTTGIAMEGCTNMPGAETYIVNNLIYNTGSLEGFAGIECVGSGADLCSGINIYHNTIQHTMALTVAPSYGVYFNNPVSNINIRNNIISITGSGSGIKTGIYFGSVASVNDLVNLRSDNNIFHIAGSSNNHIGYLLGQRTTLSAWQSFAAQDANSLAADPSFTSLATGNLAPLATTIDNKGGIIGIALDQPGNVRSLNTPDAGAIEFTTGAVCTGTPNAGNTLASVSYACNLQPFSLSHSISLTPYNLRYRWQSSPSGIEGTYSDLPNDTLKVLSITQSATTWYRSIVSCGTASDTTTAVMVKTAVTPMSGTYTVNSTLPASATNYQSFNALLSELHCVGVTGPVTVNVNSGQYPAPLVFNKIPGASATNTITFKGNGAFFAQQNAPVLTMSNVSYLTLDSFGFTSTAAQSGPVVHIGDSCRYISILKTGVSSIVSLLEPGTAGIAISGSVADLFAPTSGTHHITISGGNLNSSNYSIILNGNKGPRMNSGNIISNNFARHFFRKGIWVLDNDSVIVSGNILTRNSIPSGPGNLYGITMERCRSFRLSGNRITDILGLATVHGITLDTCMSDQGYEAEVTNNVVAGSGSNSFNGIGGNVVSGVRFYHNTVQFNGTSSQASRGLNMNGMLSDIVYMNNLMVLSGTGTKTGLHFGATPSGLRSNNNIIYVTGAGTNSFGYWLTSKAYIADWQVASGQDLLSASWNPALVNFIPTEPTLDNIGFNKGILNDVRDSVRNMERPDAGAYEFSAAVSPCSAVTAGEAVVNGTGYVCAGTMFQAGLKQHLRDSGFRYQWQSSLSGISGSFTDLTADTFSVLHTSQTTTHWFRVVVRCGSVADTSTSVMVHTLPGAMSGSYTIDPALPTSTTNFKKIKDVTDALKCAGIAGPVTINVVASSGPYTESVEIENIPGMSALNTISFLGNGNAISNASSPLISFRDASYVTFDNFIIGGGAHSGVGVSVSEGSHHITISNNKINLDTVSTSMSIAGVVMSGSGQLPAQEGGFSQYVTITGNEIRGGAYGISFTGRQSDHGDSYGHLIANNIIRKFYYAGVYGKYADSTVILNNRILRQARSSNLNGYLVYMNASSRIKIQRNRLSNDAINASQFICFTDCVNLSESESEVSNNLIYNTTNYALEGIYCLKSKGIRIVHNTIHSLLQGMRMVVADGTERIVLRNNIFSLASGSYPFIFISGNPGSVISNNNVFRSPQLLGNNFSVWNGTYVSSLPMWQLLSGQDHASLFTDPKYVLPVGDNFIPDNFEINNKGFAEGVAVDINGNTRSMTVPDPGAFEFSQPCSGVTDVNSLVASPGFSCGSQSFSIDIEDHTSREGYVYRWQLSDSGTPGTFSDLPDTGRTLVASQSSTKWYRVIVSCGVTSDTSETTLIRSYATGLSGNFTMDTLLPRSATNYHTYEEILGELKCRGISGPVTYNISAGSGRLNNQLLFEPITGTSATNTVTFIGNGNTISGSVSPLVVFENNTSHIILDSFNIRANTGFAGFGVHIGKGAHHLTIRNSRVQVDTAAFFPPNAHAGIVVSGSKESIIAPGDAKYITLQRNMIKGGYYGIMLQGDSMVSGNYGHTILGNTIQAFNDAGIQASFSDSILINGNDITRAGRTNSVATTYGISLIRSKGARIIQNRLHDFGVATGNAVSLDRCINNTGQYTEVINNIMYATAGTLNGVYTAGEITNLKIYHNTVSHSTVTNTGGNGIYLFGTYKNVLIKNNIIAYTGTGTGQKVGIYVTNPDQTLLSDNNVIYIATTSNNNIGFWGTLRTTLSAWQAASGQDMTSLTGNPQFVSAATGNLTPASLELDNRGLASEVATDINNVSRSLTSPDAGAIEFSAALPCSGTPDAGNAIASQKYVCPSTGFNVTLSGNVAAADYRIRWQSSLTGAAGSYTDHTNDTLKILTATQTLTKWYRAIVSCGSIADTSESVVVRTANTPMAGAYTLNPAVPVSATNYHTFRDVITELKCVGVSAPVVVNVAAGSGPYNEQVLFDSIPGASSVNTITFNGNLVTITGNVSPLVSFSYASHIILDSFTIAWSSGVARYGVYLGNRSHHISITNNTINMGGTGGSTSAGIISSGSLSELVKEGSNATYLTISGNTFNGQSMYAISLTGDKGNKDNFGHVISNNTILSYVTAGINLVHADTVTVSGNTVTRPASSGTNYVIMLKLSRGVLIERNRLHNVGGSLAAGIALDSCISNPGYENKIINNLIYNFTGTATYGIYALNNAVNGLQVYHNTISFTNASVNVKGIYLDAITTNTDIRNNIFSLTGSAFAVGLSISVPSGSVRSDYNNFHLASGAKVGEWNGSRISLNEWQLASGQDLFSTTINPQFTNASLGNFVPLATTLNNKGTSLPVPADFSRVTRPVIGRDMGAFEFGTNTPCTGTPDAGDAVASARAVCTSSSFTLTLSTALNGTGYRFRWQSSSSGYSGTFSDLANDTLNSFSLVQDSSKWYRAIVSCGSSVDTSSAVLVRTTRPFAGTYTINAALPVSGSNLYSLRDALAEMRCAGITGSVVLNMAPAQATILELGVGMIPGTSEVNTITINGNGNKIDKVSLDHALSLNRSEHITFDGFELMGVNINQGSHHVIISNCKIYDGTIKVTQATNTSFFLNEITGQIVVDGSASIRNSYAHLISNNMFKENAGITGIQVYRSDSVLITGNNSNSFTGQSSIMASLSNYVKIIKNRTHAISISNAQHAPGFESEITGNVIANSNHPGFTGIHCESVSGVNIYHNTIHHTLPGSNSVARGIYLLSGISRVNVLNNIVQFGGYSTGAKTALEVESASADFNSDHNVFYPAGTQDNYVGVWAGNTTATFTDWKLLSGRDAASVYANPVFVDAATNDFKPQSAFVDNIGTPVGVLTDINGTPRSIINPDAGAYEFNGAYNDLKITYGELKRSSVCYSTNDTIRVNFVNQFGNPYDFATVPLTMHWEITGPVSTSGQFTISTGSLNAGDTFKVKLPDADRSLPGNYYLRAYLQTTISNPIAENDTLLAGPFFVKPIFTALPKNIVADDPSDSAYVRASSDLFPDMQVFISEVCHNRSTTGAPVGGWAAYPYIMADDYVEITGEPGADFSGYMLEEWKGAALQHRAVFNDGTYFNSKGLMIVATGTLGASIPSPSNFYYHSGNTATHTSTSDPRGYILRSKTGVILDVVVYGTYTFPVIAGVTSVHWTGSTPSVTGSGIKLNGTDNNSGTNWVSAATVAQNPNVLNANVPQPVPAVIPGLTWTYLGDTVSHRRQLLSGPYTTPGTYQYVGIYTNQCGTFYDTVTVTATSGVPVQLLSFTGKKSGNDAMLNWITASEHNNRMFVLQRSYDEVNYDDITTVEGKGTTMTRSAYSYMDAAVFDQYSGTVYYRLKQVDYDNNFELSHVVALHADHKPGLSALVIPNPFELAPELVINAPEEDLQASVNVYDINGRMITIKPVQLLKGDTRISLEELKEEKSGIYFVRISTSNGVLVKKIVKL